MSAQPLAEENALTTRLHAAASLVLIGVCGRAWLAFWLRIYPHAATVVRWTLHEELRGTPPSRRWRRALAFYAQLPSLAAAQARAESDPATETGGEPPEPPRPARSAGWDPGSIARGLGLALAIAFAVVTALVMWVNGLSTLGDLIDADATSGDATGAIAVSLLYALVPLGLVLNRRRFAWTPPRRAGAGEPAPIRAAWWIATAAFGLLALVVYLMVFGHFVDAYDWELAADLHFGAALGAASVALIAMAPLGWVARRRYWTGRESD